MKTHLPEAFQPRLGLSSVCLAEDTSASTLPSDSRLQPIDAAVEARLQAMLHARTFDALILDALRPRIVDRAVLAPAMFHAMRAQVVERLEAMQHETADPDALAELHDALELLRTRDREHQLGECFRYSLLKG